VQNSEICGYTTVLVAPEAYFQDELKGFNARVNYEMICTWFANQCALGERIRYKLSLLHSAIEKGTTGYQMIADAAVTRFWAAYWALVQEIAPELQMEEPGQKPAGSTFIYFRGYDLPKGVSLCHTLPHGTIDVQFAGMSEKLSTVQERYAARLPKDMRITRAGKSAVIRSTVPCLSVANDIDVQKHDIIHGIKTAQYMLKWYHQAEYRGPLRHCAVRFCGISNAFQAQRRREEKSLPVSAGKNAPRFAPCLLLKYQITCLTIQFWVGSLALIWAL